MTTTPTIRHFKYSDADFVQIADSKINAVERDFAELETYGITAAFIADYRAKRNAFAHAPTDYMLSGMMMMATQAKNETHNALTIAIRRVGDRVRIKYGEAHGIYSNLGIAKLSKQPSHELLRTGRSVVETCTSYLAQLASEGVTAPMLAHIAALSEDLDEQIDAQRRAIKNRDMAVFERITLGNELYDMMVSICAKGKSCWYGVNEAKYNDYIIYTHSSKRSQSLEGTVDAGMVINLSVEDPKEDTIFTIENTGNEALSFFFAAQPTDATTAVSQTIAAHSTAAYNALQLGYSAQAKRLNVHNSGNAPSSYKVQWE